MELLKTIFGQEALTLEQFTEKLKGAGKDGKDIKLADLTQGEYVSKNKFDTLEMESKSYKERLAQADEKLNGYDPEWQTKAQQAQEKAQGEIQAVKFDFALSNALKGAKAKNPVTVKALLDMEGLKANGEEIIGLQEQLEKIKADNAFLFENETPPPEFSTPSTPAPSKAGEEQYLDDFYKGNPFYNKT